MNEKTEKLSLRGYYEQLPERTAPKSEFLESIVRQCGVTWATARNWVLYGIKPSKPEYVAVISDITGIKEEDLWQE